MPKLLIWKRLLFILGGGMLYSLGAGIAHYLGTGLDWSAYLAGQGCITFLQLCAMFLKDYFDSFAPDLKNKTGRFVPKGILPRQQALMVAATALTGGAVLTVLMQRSGWLNLTALFILGLGLFIALFYSAPPFRLAESGYGELSLAILLSNLAPALAFELQTGELHRLVVMTTTPLTFLYIAMSIVLAFPTYASDIKYGNKTLLLRLGWKRGIQLHNLLILVAFVSLGTAISLGLPWLLAWPALTVIPLGIYQIVQLVRLGEGAKPRWSLLTFTALATFSVTAYLFAYTFWTG
jgi:1,4-dihydroxy-2-naphthoate octaprenyltransferase